MKELTEIQADPNSTIHFSYFSKSAAETDFAIFLRANSKSPLVTGIWSSSLESARISSGLRPLIRRLMAIKDASLKTYQDQWESTVVNVSDTFNYDKVKEAYSKDHFYTLLRCRSEFSTSDILKVQERWRQDAKDLNIKGTVGES